MDSPITTLELDATGLKAVCRALGDTHNGLTTSDIEDLLKQFGIPDLKPTDTKWRRLHAALRHASRSQLHDVVHAAMNPATYIGRSDVFEQRRTRLNQALGFWSLELRDDGRIYRTRPLTTLGEAEARANRLQSELKRRNVHPDVLAFCQAELLQDNFFHAVFEATKSIAEKIRKRTGLTSDGAALVNDAFGTKNGRLAFNTLQTDTERSEHNGLCELIRGAFGTFRNPTAHAPRISWSIEESDALDLLTLASFIHRRIDAAVERHR